MLTRRIIPCLDVKDGRVVKGVQFQSLRDAGDPAEQAAFYDREGADELVYLDISASKEGRRTLLETVRRTADRVFIPLTVGGGISDEGQIGDILAAGADKVSINSAAVRDPALITRAALRFGSQCVVVAIDARADGPGRWRVWTHGGSKPTDLDAVEWARRVQELGAGEILLTSMDEDGRREGYAVALTRAVVAAVSIPVIASGGAGEPRHFVEVLRDAGADAPLAASVFHYRQLRISEVKAELAREGVPVRIEPD